MRRVILALFALCGLMAPCLAQDGRPTALLLDGLGIYVENSYVGVSTLAPRLQQQGYRTVVDTHFMRKSSRETPALIIGHSLGGTSALRFARQLVASGHASPLVITIDAAPGSPPCLVAQCINIHSPGFPDISGAQNIDAWRSGAYMVNHALLATNPAIQQIVLQYTAVLMAHLVPPAPLVPLPTPAPVRPLSRG